MVKIAPEDGGVESCILLHLRNFSGLAQVTQLELSAHVSRRRKSPRPRHRQGGLLQTL